MEMTVIINEKSISNISYRENLYPINRTVIGFDLALRNSNVKSSKFLSK